jgi:protein-tyrosine phosphatase
MPTVLFVCTANRYRSPIAEACFRQELSKHAQNDGWKVLSAGTWTTDGLPPMQAAIKDAEKFKLDIRNHQSCVITKDLIEDSSLILVMEQGQKEALRQEFPKHREKILLLSEVSRGIPYDIPDPMADPAIGSVAGEIYKLIEGGFEKICALANKP